jgi:PAS domain S-box-containing protein
MMQNQHLYQEENNEYDPITERNKTEEALRESEEKYRLFVEGANEGIVLTQDGEIRYMNPRAVEFSGYSEKDLISQNFTTFIHPEDREAVIERYLSKMKGEDLPLDSSYRIINKNGTTKWVQSRSALLTWQGKPALLTFLTDITERKRMEDELRESQARQDLVLRSLPMAFYIAQPFGDYGGTWVSEQIDQISGFTAKQFSENVHLWASRLHPEDRNHVFAEFESLLRRNAIRVEYRWQAADDRYLWFQDNAVLVRDEKGEPKEIIGTWLDITESKQVEEQKEKLQALLIQAQKMESIGNLSGGIAHDFNNILTPIIVQSELALMDLDKKSPIRFNIEEVKRAGLRARDLVKQILTYSRQTEQQTVPLKMTPIIKEVSELLRASLPSTIEIRHYLKEGNDTVTADPTQIHQVLMNLCTNAGHAMRERDGILEVGLIDVEFDSDDTTLPTDLVPGPYLKLTVSDTGHGIPSEVMDRIFDPFYTTKERTEGTGMGLAVVHGIISSYGGAITVESELDKGTTFHVFLPGSKSKIREQTRRFKQIPTGSEEVLIVDDEIVMANTIKRMLDRLGYKVTSRTSSLEALELFRNKPDRFDLVITDMTMPQMTGDKLSEALMEIRSDLPVILCTGYSEHISEGTAEELGIKAFVMKPIVMREIATTIREVLDK